MKPYRKSYQSKSGKQAKISKWYISFFDHNEIRRELAAFTNKSASEGLQRNLVDLVSYRKSGLELSSGLQEFVSGLPVSIMQKLVKWQIITGQRAASGKHIDKHIQDYKQSLETANRTADYIKAVIPRIQAVTSGLNIQAVTELDPERIGRYIANLKVKSQKKDAKEKDLEPLSEQSRKHYTRAMKQFSRWLQQSGRAAVDPLARLAIPKVTEQKRPRRAMTLEEIGRLLETTKTSPETRYNLTGYQRYLIYRLTLETGLRAKEIRTLTAASIGKDTVTIQAKNEKARRGAVLPLKPELAELIRDHIRAKAIHPAGRVFDNMPEKPGKMLEPDLKAAKIEKKTEAGQIDFHSLRHTFCTLLAQNGVNIQTAQRLMRHSSPELTSGFYTHLLVSDLRAGADLLPDITSYKNRQKKTGTDDTESLKKVSAPVSADSSKSGVFYGTSRHNTRGKTGVSMQSQNPLNALKNPVFDSENEASGVMPAKRLELPTPGLQNQCLKNVNTLKENTYKTGKTEFQRQFQQNLEKPAEIDPDLQMINDHWPDLPEHIRQAIKSLIQIEGK